MMAESSVSVAASGIAAETAAQKLVGSEATGPKHVVMEGDSVNGGQTVHGLINSVVNNVDEKESGNVEGGIDEINRSISPRAPDETKIASHVDPDAVVLSGRDVDDNQMGVVNGEPQLEKTTDELQPGLESTDGRVGSGEASIEAARKETGWGFGQSSSSTWSSISEPGSGRPPGLLPGSVSQEDEQSDGTAKGTGTSSGFDGGERQASSLASSSGGDSSESEAVVSGLSGISGEGLQRYPLQSEALQQRNGWIPGKRHPDQDDSSPEWRSHKKHILVLSNAGKPIYSRYGDELKLAGLSATIQAIMSFVENRGDQIYNVSAGLHQIVFLVRGPLYLVIISATDEPVAILRRQLELLHGQMISILTSAVEKCFTKNPKFDMRPLLLGTEGVLSSLVHAFSWDWATFLSAYTCIPLSYAVRQAVTASLQLASESGLLFGLLVSGPKVISLVTPWKTPLHPDDLLLLTNLISSSDSFRSSETFLPVCLPIFSPNAFLYAYINYLQPHVCLVLITSNPDGFYTLQESRAKVHDALVTSGALYDVERAATCGGLRVEFLASDFAPSHSIASSLQASAVNEWGMQIPPPTQPHPANPPPPQPNPSTSGRPDSSPPPPVTPEENVRTEAGSGEGDPSSLPAQLGGGGGALSGPAGLWHFVYRSESLSQFVASEFAGALADRASQKRLFRAYERVYASVHGVAGAGGAAPFRMQYRREEEQVILAWRTADFELYAAFDPLADKASAITVCNRVTQWLRDLECDYFLLGSLHW